MMVTVVPSIASQLMFTLSDCSPVILQASCFYGMQPLVVSWPQLKLTKRSFIAWLSLQMDHSFQEVLTGCILRLWHMEALQKPAIKFIGHAGPINCCTASVDASRLYSCSEDRSIRVWDMNTGQPLANVEAHSFGVQTIALGGVVLYLVVTATLLKCGTLWQHAASSNARKTLEVTILRIRTSEFKILMRLNADRWFRLVVVAVVHWTNNLGIYTRFRC